MYPCDPDKLTAYVDGALPEPDAARIRAHLSACPECAATVQDHRAIKNLLAARAAATVAPPVLTARVNAALDRTPPGGGPFSRPSWTGVRLGMVALVVAGGAWLARPAWQPRPVDVQALMWHHRHTTHPPADHSFATSDAEAGRAWLVRRTRKELPLPPVQAPLRGVGVCQVGREQAAIWMYRAEKPVSLIQLFGEQTLPEWGPPPSVGACSAGWRAGTYGGYNALVWQADGETYALVSELPVTRLTELMKGRRL